MEYSQKDAMIDDVVQSMISPLKEALLSVLSGGAAAASFDCASVQNEAGIQMSFRCFITSELPGIIMQSVADGIGKSSARLAQINEQMQKEDHHAMRYRIFTNDRRLRLGIPMYSCLKEVEALSPEEALKHCPPQFNAPNYAPAKAIRWPVSAQTDDEKRWLRRHVG